MLVVSVRVDPQAVNEHRATFDQCSETSAGLANLTNPYSLGNDTPIDGLLSWDAHMRCWHDAAPQEQGVTGRHSYWIPGSWNLRMSYTDESPFSTP